MAETSLILETLVKGTEQARKSLNNVTKGLDAIGIAAGAAFTAVVALGTASVMQASKLQDLRQQFDTML